MSPYALASAGLAGFAYGITPGPGVLAVLGIGAARGRRAGAAFLGGHFVGDLIWYLLALASIIGATSVDRTVFRLLGLVSGVYLSYLGLRALLDRRTLSKLLANGRPSRGDAASGPRLRPWLRRILPRERIVPPRRAGAPQPPPFLHGLLFGATNPKSYPVAAAMFTALLAGQAATLTWTAMPSLVLFACLGSAIAYAMLVGLVGLDGFRELYRRHQRRLQRISGLIFIAFGSRSIADALRR